MEEGKMISVVIPAYNAQETIVDCINGVLKQTREDVIEEIIVVDDGSKDNTVRLIESNINDERVRIISKENGGVSTARNIGIRNAKSEWIALLDSDDVWTPTKIEKQIEAIKKHPEIFFIGTNRNRENVRMGKRVDTNIYRLGLRSILIKNWPHTSTVLIKNKVFNDVGLFDEKMRYAEDGNLWNRIVIKYPLYYIAETLEIAGGNKMAYGEKGLSSNLKGMHEGNIHNLRCLKNESVIGTFEYWCWRIYFNIKYIKRIIVTKVLSKKRKEG